jgi:hypothetical protein
MAYCDHGDGSPCKNVYPAPLGSTVREALKPIHDAQLCGLWLKAPSGGRCTQKRPGHKENRNCKDQADHREKGNSHSYHKKSQQQENNAADNIHQPFVKAMLSIHFSKPLSSNFVDSSFLLS